MEKLVDYSNVSKNCHQNARLALAIPKLSVNHNNLSILKKTKPIEK